MRRLLLRTSALERVNGELADLLTGQSGGERVLQELEEANAFVVSLDAGRFWFRYHQMFADLLQLELRRTAPGEVTGLHQVAAQWLAGHGYPVEAIRHAQAARDWGLAARLLSDHWPGLYLGGQAATIHALLAGFPAGPKAADAELAGLVAGDELARGSLEEAERFLGLAARGSASVPTGRRAQWQVLLGVVRLLLARQRGNLEAVAEEARRLQAVAEAPEAALHGLGEELRALALINLGIAEAWAGRLDQAQRHLEQGIALAHRTGRPYLEFTGLAHQAGVEAFRSLARAEELGRQAVELAERHGWTDDPAAGAAYVALASGLVWQGRFKEAEGWVQHAERTGRPEADPAANMGIRYVRALLELARGRDHEAVAAFHAAERLAGLLPAPHVLLSRTWALQLHALVRLASWSAPSGFSPASKSKTANAGRSAPPRRRCGSPRMTRARRPLHWRRSSRAQLPFPAVLAGSGLHAGGDRPGHARRRSDRRPRDRARPRSRRARPCAVPVAPLPRAGTAGAPCPGLRQTRGYGLGDPHPASRPAQGARTARGTSVRRVPPYSGGSGGGVPLSSRAAEPKRDPRAALPAHQLVGCRDRPRAVPIGEHGRTHTRHLFAKLGTHRRTESVERARALGLLAASARQR